MSSPGQVEIRRLDPDGVDAVQRMLDGAEEAAGHALVDEGERQRLDEFDTGSWEALVACAGAEIVGYGGVTLPVDADGMATAEIVVAPPRRRSGVGGALLAAVEDIACHRAARLSLWVRATDTGGAFATARGYRPTRRLDVLGRPLDVTAPPSPPADPYLLRSYRPDVDDDALVAVLRAAFADHPERDWTHGDIARRRRRPWFEPDAVVVATDDDDRPVGLHWTKYRGGDVGEVHLLAVAPRAQGNGLGPALLEEGLGRLRTRGATQALLWVEHDNEPARRLYERAGFTRRWSMGAFEHDLDAC